MKKILAAITITATIAAAATHQYLQHSADRHQSDLQSKLHTVEQALSATKKDLLGYTTFTQYLEVTKKAISGRTKFLAAKIDRDYVHVEHIRRSVSAPARNRFKSADLKLVRPRGLQRCGMDANWKPPATISRRRRKWRDGLDQVSA